MSKSQAIEGVMKIFLMIAVIIVGMSFLLKAFGIDIIGWLEGMLRGFTIPKDGSALYVKLDTDKKDIFDFRLTNDKFFLVDNEALAGFKSYFYISDFPKGKCTILTAQNRGRGGWEAAIPMDRPDKGGVYYVKPGTILQENCASIGECIKDFIDPPRNLCEFKEAKRTIDVCDSQCSAVGSKSNKLSLVQDKCEGPYSYVDCDASGVDIENYLGFLVGGIASITGSYDYCDYDIKRKTGGRDLTLEGKVINEPFGTTPQWSCTGNRCNLLNQDDKTYEIKYGIICDTDGKWKVCSSTKTVGDPLFKADCNWDNVAGTWVIDKKTPKIECAFPELPGSSGCIFDQPSITVTGGSVWVCGKLTINGEPVLGRKLTLERFDQYQRWVPVTEISNTGDDGRACLKWIPPSTDVFRNTQNRYKITFSGDNLFNPATGEERKLCIGPDLPC